MISVQCYSQGMFLQQRCNHRFTASHHRANTPTGYGLQRYKPDPLEHPDIFIPLQLHQCLMKFTHHSVPQPDTQIIKIHITQDTPWTPVHHSGDQPDPAAHRALIQTIHQQLMPNIDQGRMYN